MFKSLAFISIYLKYPRCSSSVQTNAARTIWKPLLSKYQQRLYSGVSVDIRWVTYKNRKSYTSSILSFKSSYSTQGGDTEGKIPHSKDMKGEPQSASDAYDKTWDKENFKDTSEKADSDSSKIWKLKLRLLQYCASTDRGQNCNQRQKMAIEELASSLEARNPTPNPVEASLMDGLWYLSYVSEKFYAMNAVLAAIAVTPLASVGQVRQEISISSGELTNEFDLILFPNITGAVVTKARINPVDGERLQVFDETTTIRGKSFGDQFDLGNLKLDVPVDDLRRRLKGTSPETFLDTYYLDEDMRISRTQGGCLFVFTRFPEV